MQKDSYELLDSGHFKKLERFGPYIIERPALSACWEPSLTQKEWNKQRHASFIRIPSMEWKFYTKLPEHWTCSIEGIKFKLKPTDFGHLGVFPEQASTWQWLQKICKQSKKQLNVLNLFAYSGGVSLACAKSQAKITHLDASKGMVSWAKENANLNKLPGDSIRWIVDDVIKFLQREQRRGNKYDGIILDPPSYGKGKKGEVFKIEEDLVGLLKLISQVLSPSARFVFLSCHTPALTPISLSNILQQGLAVSSSDINAGELTLANKGSSFNLPSGTYAKWEVSE